MDLLRVQGKGIAAETGRVRTLAPEVDDDHSQTAEENVRVRFDRAGRADLANGGTSIHRARLSLQRSP
jgi:hypothetical protein